MSESFDPSKIEIIIEGEEEEEEETEDYKFYVIKVPPGREYQLIFLIRHRTLLLKLPILSAFKTRNLDGVVFVEAKNYQAVVDAIREFRYAHAFRDPLTFEEVENYLKEFQIRYEKKEEEEEEEIVPGMRVIIIQGPFKGREARVVSVSKKKVWLEVMGGGAMIIEASIDDIRVAKD